MSAGPEMAAYSGNPTQAREAMRERADAAREAVERGVDGPLALSYAVWPTTAVLEAQRERWSDRADSGIV